MSTTAARPLPLTVLATLVVVLLTAVPAVAQVPEGPLAEATCAALPGVDDRCEAWVQVHDPVPDPAEPYQFASAHATSPDGALVVAAGYGAEDLAATGGQARSSWRIVAFDGAEGTQRWVAAPGPTGRYARPLGAAVSRDGSLVLAAGWASSAFGARDADLIVVALDAGTGEVRWERTITGADIGQGAADVRGWRVADTGQGTAVVLGTFGGGSGSRGQRLLTAVLDLSDGGVRGLLRHTGAVASGTSVPVGLSVAEDGRSALIGATADGPGPFDIDMFAMSVDVADAASPQERWTLQYDGRRAAAPDRLEAMQVHGDRLYLTGISGNDVDGPPFAADYDITTLAVDAADGAVRWESRTRVAPTGFVAPSDIAVDGDRVVLVGSRPTAVGREGWALSLDPADGQTRWLVGLATTTPGTSAYDIEAARGVALVGDRVITVGSSLNSVVAAALPDSLKVSDSLVVALDVEDGRRAWTARHNATGIGDDTATAVLGAGDRAFVLGNVTRNVENDRNFYDFSVLAYDVG